jgi:hypothetical protein
LADFAAELMAEARARFVRFDADLWNQLVDGPARDLARSLQANVPSQRAERLLENYLRLGCEAIGLGYLFPESAGQSFFTLAWNRLIPRSLALLPAQKQGQALADCWNFGENLERSPAWLRRIALRLATGLEGLGQLNSLVEKIAEALAEPQARLGEKPRIEWVHLAEEDRRFLPGALHFVAPTVACVHDRHRSAAAGGEVATVGVWLAEQPLALGPMGCEEEPGGSSERLDLLDYAQKADRRAADVLNAAANDWRCALTLETSQFLVALLP